MRLFHTHTHNLHSIRKFTHWTTLKSNFYKNISLNNINSWAINFYMNICIVKKMHKNILLAIKIFHTIRRNWNWNLLRDRCCTTLLPSIFAFPHFRFFTAVSEENEIRLGETMHGYLFFCLHLVCSKQFPVQHIDYLCIIIPHFYVALWFEKQTVLSTAHTWSSAHWKRQKKQKILWKARMVQCEYVQMMCVRNQRAKNTKIGSSVVVEKATPKNLNEM